VQRLPGASWILQLDRTCLRSQSGVRLGTDPLPIEPQSEWFALSLPLRALLTLFFWLPIAGPPAPNYSQPMDTVTNTDIPSFDQILSDFEMLEDWEDRYRYVIELGRKLEPLPDPLRNADTKVQGCVSQVWLSTTVHDEDGPRLTFVGDSDAHIVRGLVAILFAIYSGKTANEILGIDAVGTLGELHLNDHLTPQRSNGLMAMVTRIRKDAESARVNAS